MPVETTSETTEQRVSTVEEDSPKQSKPDLADSELPDDDPNEPTPSTSKNVLINGLKRPLQDGVDDEKKKKFRLTVSRSMENQSDDESNVSNKTHDNLKNGNNGIDDKHCKEDYPHKNNTSKNTNKERKKLNSSEIMLKIVNNSEKKIINSIENSKVTVKNGKNILTKNDILTTNGISCLNKSSSSDNLAITENSDHENVAVVNDIQVTENIPTAVNDSTVRESNSKLSNTKINTIENIVNSKKNDVEPLLEFKSKLRLSENTDETTSIESSPCSSNTNNSKKVDVCSNGTDREYEVVDSDDSFDISSSDLTDSPEDIKSIILGVRETSKKSFPQYLQMFSENRELTFEQFDNFCTQKVVAMMTDRCKDRPEIQLIKKREKIWRIKYDLLERQLKEMKTILSVHRQEVGGVKLPKEAIPLPKPDPISISVEDDDDVVILDFETVESASSSTSKITNATTKKQMPPLVTTSKTLVVSPKNVTASPKTVTAAKSLNPINIGTTHTTIDLTGNDDVIEESNIINLEDSISPIKTPRRIVASLLPAGTLVSGNSENTITYLELSNNPSTSSSSFITRTASRPPQQTIVLNKDTINTSPKSKNLTSILVSRVDPVLVQPCAVTYTAHRVPVSGTLQQISTASYSPRKITVSHLSASLNTLTPSYTTCQIPASLGTSHTTCRAPISLLATNRTGTQSTKKPPPPAIPLLKHPSPVPGIPNQKSLPSWKRLPPAPNLTISKTSEALNNNAQGLVLSWTMNLNTTIADIISYQIYAYQETTDRPPNIELWKKIGDVKALSPPMSCSLTHFTKGQKYHFLVRAVDVYTRVGPFSNPESIL